MIRRLFGTRWRAQCSYSVAYDDDDDDDNDDDDNNNNNSLFESKDLGSEEKL